MPLIPIDGPTTKKSHLIPIEPTRSSHLVPIEQSAAPTPAHVGLGDLASTVMSGPAAIPLMAGKLAAPLLPTPDDKTRKFFGYTPKSQWAQGLLRAGSTLKESIEKYTQPAAAKVASYLPKDGPLNIPTLAASAMAGPVGLPLHMAQKALMQPRTAFQDAVQNAPVVGPNNYGPEGLSLMAGGAVAGKVAGAVSKARETSQLAEAAGEQGWKVLKDANQTVKGVTSHFPAIEMKNGQIVYSEKYLPHPLMIEPLEKVDPGIFEKVQSTGVIDPATGKYTSAIKGEVSAVARAQRTYLQKTGKNLSLEDAKRLAAMPTGAPTKKPTASIVNQLVLPERTALKRQAPIAGRAIVEASADAASDAHRTEGHLMQVIEKADLKKTPAQKEAIKEFLDKGKTVPGLDDEALNLAKRLEKGMETGGRLAQKRGTKVNIGTEDEHALYLKNHHYPNTPDTKAYEDPINRLQQIHAWMAGDKTKDIVTNVEDGERVLDTILNVKDGIVDAADFAHTIKGVTKFSSIEKPRVFDLMFKNPDPVDAYTTYVQRLSKRVAAIKHFGQTGSKLREMAAAAVNEGANKDFVDTTVDTLLGSRHINESASNLGRKIRQWQSITKMQTSGAINIQQGTTNSLIRSGGNLSAVVKGTKDAFTKEGIQFALETGGVKGQDITKYQDEIAGLAGKTDKMDKIADLVNTMNGMKHSETGVRIQAANIGRRYINESLVPRFMKKPTNPKILDELKEFRLNPRSILAKAGKLSRSEELRAAEEWVAQTQFGLRPLATPQALTSSETGKVIGQYSSFLHQQGALVGHSIKRYPVRAPAAIAGTAFTVNKGLKAIQSFISGRPPEYKTSLIEELQRGHKMEVAKRLAKDLLEGGAGGKIGSVLLSSEYGAQAVTSALLGPTVGGDLADLAKVATSDHKFLEAGRQIIKRIPIVGQSIKNRLLPTLPPKKKSTY